MCHPKDYSILRILKFLVPGDIPSHFCWLIKTNPSRCRQKDETSHGRGHRLGCPLGNGKRGWVPMFWGTAIYMYEYIKMVCMYISLCVCVYIYIIWIWQGYGWNNQTWSIDWSLFSNSDAKSDKSCKYEQELQFIHSQKTAPNTAEHFEHYCPWHKHQPKPPVKKTCPDFDFPVSALLK